MKTYVHYDFLPPKKNTIDELLVEILAPYLRKYGLGILLLNAIYAFVSECPCILELGQLVLYEKMLSQF